MLSAFNKSKTFQQQIAALLLLLFIWDIALHVSLHSHDDLGSPFLSISGGKGSTAPAGDVEDLGDGRIVAHHHHAPVVLVSSGFALALTIVARAANEDSEKKGHSSAVSRLIRAPPSLS
ncbi:MAG: hypothetical protein HY648_01155 [Acidobacteria bacterium]|nr:hypothetical protein [Acidobacteriota bacterium]